MSTLRYWRATVDGMDAGIVRGETATVATMRVLDGAPWSDRSWWLYDPHADALVAQPWVRDPQRMLDRIRVEEIAAPPPVTVIEVDQWTSTADQWRDRSLTFDEIVQAISDETALDRLSGGDAAAARVLFGGRCRVRVVEAIGAGPTIGDVWFQRGDDGYPERWKANYDSSD